MHPRRFGGDIMRSGNTRLRKNINGSDYPRQFVQAGSVSKKLKAQSK
jgi:hypothetical protein